MNYTSKLNFYETLTIYFSGVLLCLPFLKTRDLVFIGTTEKLEYKIVYGIICFIVVYLIGLLYHRLLEAFKEFSCLSQCCRKQKMLNAYFFVFGDKYKSIMEEKTYMQIKRDYDNAYYSAAERNLLSGVGHLETQRGFLQDIIIILLLYCFVPRYCKLLLLCNKLLVLGSVIIVAILALSYTQWKIYYLVWSAEYYLQENKVPRTLRTINLWDLKYSLCAILRGKMSCKK